MNPLRLFFGIFALVGAICLAIAIPLTYRTTMKMNQWEVVMGTITSLDNSGYPNITFQYNGKEFSFLDHERGTNIVTGMQLKVHFPAGRPELAEIKSFVDDWLAPMLLWLFALVFGGIGGGGIYGIVRRSHIKQELVDMGKGTKVSCPVSVSMDTSFSVNGRHPYILIAQQYDKIGTALREFKSEHIWYNPTTLMENKKNVDVYVDPNDPTRYWVDISFLPKKA